MDFSFATLAMDYLVYLLQYLIYGLNPFSVLFYIGLGVGVVGMLMRFFKGAL